jgi:phosphoglycolate phosphatase
VYSVVFFDLDGTLTDPSVGITRSVQYALAKFGIDAAPEELRPFIGPPLHSSFREFYAFDAAGANRAVEFYREYFVDRGIYENLLLDGIADLLADLRAVGRSLSVVTSKPTVYAEQILAHFEIRQFFENVVGAQLDLSGSEKSLLVQQATSLYPACDISSFVMVGDREHDIIGALANGLASIGVTYGAGSHAELLAAGATRIVDSVADLGLALLA